MFGTLGGPELFLILVVALIVFGPRKLPDIGKSVGRMMAEFRKASNDFKRTIEDEVEAEKLREATRIDTPSWTASDSSASSSPAALPPASSDQTAYEAMAGPAVADQAAQASGAAEAAPLEPASDAAASEAADADAPRVPAAPPDTVSRGDVPAERK
ncbi:MAG TPA: twin-arginine translocase TatA/TatE family subunit [Vicinamibacteria bacterium]